MQPGNTNIGLTACLPRYSFISFTRRYIQYRLYKPQVTKPRMSTVVGFTTFSLPGIFGAAPAAGASAMIPPYLVSKLSLRGGRLRRRRAAADVGAALRALGQGLEPLLMAARTRDQLALGPDHQVHHHPDHGRQEEDHERPQDRVLVAARLGVLE